MKDKKKKKVDGDAWIVIYYIGGIWLVNFFYVKKESSNDQNSWKSELILLTHNLKYEIKIINRKKKQIKCKSQGLITKCSKIKQKKIFKKYNIKKENSSQLRLLD
jgi:hypothetical protein